MRYILFITAVIFLLAKNSYSHQAEGLEAHPHLHASADPVGDAFAVYDISADESLSIKECSPGSNCLQIGAVPANLFIAHLCGNASSGYKERAACARQLASDFSANPPRSIFEAIIDGCDGGNSSENASDKAYWRYSCYRGMVSSFVKDQRYADLFQGSLCYHPNIWDEVSGVQDVKSDCFRSQLELAIQRSVESQ